MDQPMEGDIIKVDHYDYYVVDRNDGILNCYRITSKNKRDKRLKDIVHIPVAKAAEALILSRAVPREEIEE